MRPLEGNEEFCNNPSDSGLKTAADLIVWTGPDIPCLELCSGDTIQKVIYDLAIILCDISENVLDVTKLNFKCMLEDGACPPDTLLEALQLMINSHCNLEFPSEGGPAGTLPIVNLPVCLHYKNTDGDTITSLRLDLYAKFLADTICKIIIDVKSLKSVVTNLTTQINSLNATITGGGGSAGTSGSGGTVTSKCLSAPTPGQTIPLTTAFSNLEIAMCSYISLLGTSTEWSTLIDNQCITNTTLVPGSASEKYSDLPGWIDSPNSVVESMTNLWKVVCKLNTSTTGSTGGSSCFPAAPSLAYDNASKVISWTSPVPSSYSQPLGYKLTVKNNATSATVYQNNSIDDTSTSFNLSVYLTDATITYKIELVATYSCGDSTAGVTVISPASTGGGTGGGTSTSAFKIKMGIGKGQDVYGGGSSVFINSAISQATPYGSGTFTCNCNIASVPCTSTVSDINYDNNGFGFSTGDGCDALETSGPYEGFINANDKNFEPESERNPDISYSKWYQFQAVLVDALTENNAVNNTGKPIVVKIRVKRAYFKIDTLFVDPGRPQSPTGWSEYVVNIVIPANAVYSNWVKVYYVRGVDKDKQCRKYNQCGICYLGAYEGTTEVDSVVARPASLGTVVSSVGILTSSFNQPALYLPTSCTGIL